MSCKESNARRSNAGRTTCPCSTRCAVAYYRRVIDDPRLRQVRHWRETFTMPRYESREAWEERAAAIRERVLFAAGLLPLPERTPLNPIVAGHIEREDCVIENVAFESFPGFYCTGNLYRPVHPVGRVPAVLTPHGHWREGRFAHQPQGSVPARCISLAQQGYVVFSPDMVGYNDSRQVPHRRFESPARWLWGIGVLGLQLWNNIRALDFLQTLPEVDPQQIACTGESGGASQTFLLAAVDDRVRYAAPVCMLSAHYAGGCVCENAPGLRLDVTNMEIVACAAPRPLLIVAATGDWTANTPRVEYPAVRSIYELYGAAGRLECVQLDAGHNYNRESRELVYGFLARYLGGRAEPAPPSPSVVFWTGPSEPRRERDDLLIEPPERLRVFPDGTPLPEGALRDEREVTQRLIALRRAALEQARPRDAGTLAAFRERYGSVLRHALAASLPESSEISLEHRVRAEGRGFAIERLEVVGAAGRFPALLALPEQAPGSEVAPVVLVDPRGKGAWLAGGTIDELWPPPEPPEPGPVLAALLKRGQAALLVDVFLTGEYRSPFGAAGRPVAETHFAGYNRVDTAWRVQDILTAVVALRRLTGAHAVEVLGMGEAGLWCLLARALAPDMIAHLVADLGGFDWESEDAYLRQLCLPHLLRAGGLAGAVALAAPAALTLYHAAGRVPAWLIDLYRQLGTPDALAIHDEAVPALAE